MTRRLLLFLAAGALGCMGQQARLQAVDEAGFAKLASSQKGQVVLIDFWATWCEPCRAEMPQLVALEARHKARGFKLVTISCDEPEQEKGALDFLTKQKAPQPFYVRRARDDDKFISSIDPKWSGQLPALFLYDRQGRRVQVFYGETSAATIEAAIKKLL